MKITFIIRKNSFKYLSSNQLNSYSYLDVLSAKILYKLKKK